MSIRNEIHVIAPDGGNPTNLVGRLHIDNGIELAGYVTGLGTISFDIPDDCHGQGADVRVSCDGSKESNARVVTGVYDGSLLVRDLPVQLQPTGVNPFDLPSDVLRAFRGSIWTARMPLAYGPRPLDPSNILAIDEYPNLKWVGQHAGMIASYYAQGYRHAPIGPFQLGDRGYHDLYPQTPSLLDQPDFYLECLHDFWNGGLYPVLFLSPDGWTLDDVKRLDAIYSRPEWRQAVRLAVPHGWEPGGYNVSSDEWVARFQWARGLFPDAFLCLHMIADFDAPIGGDDGIPPRNMTKQEAWTRLAQAGCTGFLDQVAGYTGSGNPVVSDQFLADFTDRVRYFVRHFRDWGLDLDYVAGEYAAYGSYWLNYPDAQAARIGNAALAAGARGFFDGGTHR